MKKKSSQTPKKAVKSKQASKAPLRPRTARGLIAASSGLDAVYHRIQDILAEARSQAWPGAPSTRPWSPPIGKSAA